MNSWNELAELLSQLPVMAQVNATKKQLDDIRPLPKEVEGRVMQKLRLEWNYHSNAIEGNKLTFGETYSFLMYGLTAKGKPFKDHLDIKGHNEAIVFLTSLVKDDFDLTEVDIRNLHKMILVEPYQSPAQTSDGQATTKTIHIGEYKQQPNHVKTPTGEIHYFATPEETPIKMHELVQWYNMARQNEKIHPSVLAAFVHHRFVNIHPFDDGNGRLARILMNLILMKNDYPPAIVKLKERTDYYQALNQADRNEYVPLIEFLAESLLDSMNLYLKAARGESIEDDADLDKEIALFKASLKKNIMIKNDDLVKKVLKTSCKPLIDGFILKFEELLNEFNGYISFSEKTFKGYFFSSSHDYISSQAPTIPHSFLFNSNGIENFIINQKRHSGLGDWIRFDFVLKNLQQITGNGLMNTDFRVFVFIDFRNDLRYKISFKEDLNVEKENILLEKNYDDEMNEVDISKSSNDFKKYTFRALKKAIGN